MGPEGSRPFVDSITGESYTSTMTLDIATEVTKRRPLSASLRPPLPTDMCAFLLFRSNVIQCQKLRTLNLGTVWGPRHALFVIRQ